MSYRNVRRFVAYFLVLYFIANLIYNLSHGYFFGPPFELTTPVALTLLHRPLNKSISLAYPQGWVAYNFPSGNHGDKAALTYIMPATYQYPIIKIAYNHVNHPTLEQVVTWGESRINRHKFQKVSTEKITINDKPAILNGYTYPVESIFPTIFKSYQVNCHTVYILDNQENGYMIELCADETTDTAPIKTVFDQVIYSIKFSK